MPLLILTLASVSDKIVEPIVDLATEFIGSAGVVAVFLLMTLESACIPIPSEAIMLFAGFSVSKGELTLFGVVAAGVLGNLAGSWIAYAVGYYGRARPAGEEPADPRQPQAPEMGRRLVRPLRRPRPSSSRGCCRSSAPSSRCRREWRRCPSGASAPTRWPARSPGC